MITHATLTRRMDDADIELQLYCRQRAEELLNAAIVVERLATDAKRRAGRRNGIDPAHT